MVLLTSLFYDEAPPTFISPFSARLDVPRTIKRKSVPSSKLRKSRKSKRRRGTSSGSSGSDSGSDGTDSAGSSCSSCSSGDSCSSCESDSEIDNNRKQRQRQFFQQA